MSPFYVKKNDHLSRGLLSTGAAQPWRPSKHYRYARPVTLGEHRVLLRPRDSHDLRVLATDMRVTPTSVDIRLIQDVYSNSVALVQPQSPAKEPKSGLFIFG